MAMASALLLLLAATAAVVAIWWIDRGMVRAAAGRIHRDAGTAPEGDVALVLGARVYSSGQLSAVLHDRVESAVRLYNAGKVRKIIMSGDNSKSHYDEPTAMRKAAISMGVDPDDVVRDFAGFRTLDSVHRARDLWQVRKPIIVSQGFHLPRALYLADKLGLQAQGFRADLRPYLRDRQMAAREVLARVAAWMDMNVLGTAPKFLGTTESLSGLAQETAMGERSNP